MGTQVIGNVRRMTKRTGNVAFPNIRIEVLFFRLRTA